MKNKFLTIFLFLIMLVLIGGITILAGAIYIDLYSSDTSPEVYTLDGIVTEEVSSKKQDKKIEENVELVTLSPNIEGTQENNIQTNTNINNKYFYNQLNDTQKIIYTELNNNKQNLKQGNFVIKYGNSFSNILSKENGSTELGIDYQTAIEAFTHDNPELFYLDVNKMYLNIETTTKFLKTTYNVYIAPGNGATYLSSDYASIEQIDAGIAEIESIKNAMLKRLSGTDYQKIVFIHDYLVSTIDYDTSYLATGTYTLYGALVEKKCVCEGYAKAFKYLANAAGFNCEIMQGKATNSSGQTENHAWNCIEIDGKWYEIDPTWDDPIVIGNGKLTNAVKYKYFLKGTETFEKDHELSYQFSNEGKSFDYPKISSKDY